MMTLFRLMAVYCCVCLLTSCGQDFSNDYLLRHPDILKREIERCHADEAKTREVARRCEVVMSAAESFIKLLNEQQSNPEQFGIRIMETQTACANINSSSNAEDCRNMQILLAVIGVNSPE